MTKYWFKYKITIGFLGKIQGNIVKLKGGFRGLLILYLGK